MNAPSQSLILPVALREQVSKYARQGQPFECCGLLIGSGQGTVAVQGIVAADNVSKNPELRFEIDPQVQFDALRRLRGTSQRIIGHYHSHPKAPAVPSAYDLSMAHDPEAVWLIVTLNPIEALAAFICPNQAQGFQPLTIKNAE